jgi:hypothetical protein
MLLITFCVTWRVHQKKIEGKECIHNTNSFTDFIFQTVYLTLYFFLLRQYTRVLYLLQAIDKIKDICQRAKLDMSKTSLAWLLQQENVPVAITGASTPEQVAQNIDIPTLTQVFNCYFNHYSRYTKCPLCILPLNSKHWYPHIISGI